MQQRDHLGRRDRSDTTPSRLVERLHGVRRGHHVRPRAVAGAGGDHRRGARPALRRPAWMLYGFDIAVWGSVLIVLGVLLAGAAVVVLWGRDAGDTAAIWLACLGMVANFLVSVIPIWSLTIIGLSVHTLLGH